MTTTLNPRLFDVVRFRTSTTEESPTLRTGTIVELLGPDSVLVEVSDEAGTLKELVSVPIHDLEIIWSNSKSGSNEEVQDEAKSYFEKGLLLLQNGVRGAEEEFARAFQIQPNLAGTLLNLTNSLAQRGSFDNAVFLYMLITDLRPDYGLARENLAITYLNRGVDYARTGALDKAIVDFTSALTFARSESVAQLCHNNLAASHTKVALNHVQIKRFSEALQFFLAALYADPSPTTRRNYALAMVSWAAWKQERSFDVPPRDLFREPILVGLTYSDCLNAYGATLASLGRKAEAKAIIQQAVEEDSSNQLARDNLRILSRQKFDDIAAPAMWGLTSVEPQRAELAVQ